MRVELFFCLFGLIIFYFEFFFLINLLIPFCWFSKRIVCWLIDLWGHKPIYLIILDNRDSLPQINQLTFFLGLSTLSLTFLPFLNFDTCAPRCKLFPFQYSPSLRRVFHLRLGRLPPFHKRLRVHRTQAWILQCRQSKINACRKCPHASQWCGPSTRRQPPLWSQSWRSRSSRTKFWTKWTRSVRGATIPSAPGSAGRFAICWARCSSMPSSYTTQVHFFHCSPHS